MSIELTNKVERLEARCAALEKRLALVEQAKDDAVEDYLNAVFPQTVIPKIEHYLSDSGYAPNRKRGSKNATKREG